MLPMRIRAMLGPMDADASPEALRARDRHRRVIATAGASALAKAMSVATMLVSVPLTLNYMGNELYGMWVTISSFSLMLAFADLGIGNGLLTAVSRSSGQDDIARIRSYVSSAAFILAAIGAVIAIVGLAVASFIDWASLFNVQSAAAKREARPAMQIFLLCFALSLPASVIQRVQMGLQRGFLFSLWQCVASIVTLGSVIVAAWMTAPLPWLVAAFLVPSLVIGLVNSVVFFGLQMPSVAPALRCVSRKYVVEVMRIGGLFFILQITVAAAFFSDSLVISSTLGAASVTEYSIADRLFSIISQLIGFVVLPLWSAFGEALARKDSAWAWQTLVRGTAAAFGVSLVVSLLLLAGSSWIIRYWIGPGFDVPFGLLMGFALWRIVEAGAGPSSMYLNALQAIRFQVICAIAMGICALSLKLMLIRSLGVVSLPWITVCSYVAFVGIPTIFFLRRQRRVGMA